MNIIEMTPNGQFKISALAAMVKVAVADLTATNVQTDLSAGKLAEFKQALGHFSQEEIKEALRLKDKDKGETVAPFVQSILAVRPDAKDAPVRHSQFRTVFAEVMQHPTGWIDGFSGWNALVAAAQTDSKARKEKAKAQKAKDDLAIRRSRLEESLGTSPEALAEALAVATEEQQQDAKDAERNRETERAAKAASKVGYFVLPKDPVSWEDVARHIVEQYGTDSSEMLCYGIEERIAAVRKQQADDKAAQDLKREAEKQIAAEEVKAHQEEQAA